MLNALLGPGRLRLTLWITILTAGAAGILVYQKFHSLIFPVFLGLFVWQAWQALKQTA